jgi:hypothetical protein
MTSSLPQEIVPFAAGTQPSRCDHRNRDERPPLRHPVWPRPWRRRSRPLWLARHVLARLAPGGCGGLVVGGGLTQKSPKTPEGYGALLKSQAILWREEPELRRATVLQGCLFGSFSALWTILALQLDARHHLSAEIVGLFGVVDAELENLLGR